MTDKIPVCISLKPAQLAELDRVRTELDRSRSWVTAAALDVFLSHASSPQGGGPLSSLPGLPTIHGGGVECGGSALAGARTARRGNSA